MKKKRILAIDPGTRNIGIAFFKGNDLHYFGVKVIPQIGIFAEEFLKGKQIISDLIEDFKPDILAIEKTFFKNNKNSELLNRFSLELIKIAKRKKLNTLLFSANTVKKTIAGDGFASKQDVAQILISRCSELKPYLINSPKWREKYYKNIFDAVAIGLTAIKIDKNYLINRCGATYYK